MNLAERLEVQTLRTNYLAMNHQDQIQEYRKWLNSCKTAKELWMKENFRQIDESIEREKSLLGRGNNLFRSTVVEPAVTEYALANPSYKEFIMYSNLLESVKPPADITPEEISKFRD